MLTETKNKCRIPSEEDSGVNKLASAIELTKYRNVISILSRNHINHALRLAIAIPKRRGLTYGREVHLAKREPN
jgi:hypothetical protein